MVKEEFFAVFQRLLPTPEQRHDLTTQIYIFRKAQGMFALNLAKEAWNNTPPEEFKSFFSKYGQVEIKKAEPKKASNAPTPPHFGREFREPSFGDGLGGSGNSFGGFGGGFDPSYRGAGGLGNRVGGYVVALKSLVVAVMEVSVVVAAA